MSKLPIGLPRSSLAIRLRVETLARLLTVSLAELRRENETRFAPVVRASGARVE